MRYLAVVTRARPTDDAPDAPLDGRRRRTLATRAALIELATERFATQGYTQTSMRDLERDGPVTLAAIYSHFRNKADLLVAAINRRITEDLEDVPDEVRRADLVERLSASARGYRERRRLRALLVQAAAASQTDEVTRERVRDAQKAHIDDWTAGYHANRDRIGLDPAVDIDTAVLYTWAVELGLGMLEAFDLAPEPDDWADIQARVARSLLSPSAAAAARRATAPQPVRRSEMRPRRR